MWCHLYASCEKNCVIEYDEEKNWNFLIMFTFIVSHLLACVVGSLAVDTYLSVQLAYISSSQFCCCWIWWLFYKWCIEGYVFLTDIDTVLLLLLFFIYMWSFLVFFQMLADLLFRKNEYDTAMYHFQQLLQMKAG